MTYFKVYAWECSFASRGRQMAIYSVQEDTIYVNGVPAGLDHVDRLVEQLVGLKGSLTSQKTLVHANKLIEFHIASYKA
ncbi:hypothetical protein [Pseudomonas sp. BN607]|uniref:hypothetical protein n=1 Tax=Pseudomonas sp. BN607 TaxID=2567895 RepID=UPI002457C01E|nr:hypothetical protein [Pseudomonas sp. BN607]MDH4552750.1 hypothetical protein [Pseudomonas sp. BN607]